MKSKAGKITWRVQMKSLVKFRSMQEILLSVGGNFDQHGNLQVLGDHLAPVFFSYLGQLKEINASHGFPAWCIEKEYTTDSIPQNVALRTIMENLDGPLTEFQSENLKEVARRGLDGKIVWKYKSS